LRVVNPLPERRVVGLHSPEIKQVAKQLSRKGGEVVMPDGTHRFCANGAEVIRQKITMIMRRIIDANSVCFQ